MPEAWTATIQQNGHWLFTWDAASDESFDVWLDGELLDTVEGGEYDCDEPEYWDSPPPLEIIPDESTEFADNDLYPPYAILQWREVAGADAYQVQLLSGSSWLNRKTVSDIGIGFYFYRTPVLEDQVETSYRVMAVDVNGNAGTPVAFTFNIVRNPSPPDVTYEIDSAGDLVVDES